MHYLILSQDIACIYSVLENKEDQIKMWLIRLYWTGDDYCDNAGNIQSG